MAKVCLRDNGKHPNLFRLNTTMQMDNVPMVGDEIYVFERDFMNASFRVKPYSEPKIMRNKICLQFKVIKRKIILYKEPEWELICEPTAESLIFCLKNLKVKK